MRADSELGRRVERLEKTVRRQYLALGLAGGAIVATLLGGAGAGSSAPEVMSLVGDTVMGIAIEDDVAYRVRASGLVEQIAIGERREALEQLQLADPRRRVPGLRWDPIFQP